MNRALSTRDNLLVRLLNKSVYIDTREFTGRLTLQKIVYLLQAFGFYLGFRFSWYLFGPYSPDLADVGYDIEDALGTDETLTFTQPAANAKFATFLEFIEPIKSQPDQLELLASLHFLSKLGLPQNEIFEKIQKKRTTFSVEKAQKGWEYLKQFNLVN